MRLWPLLVRSIALRVDTGELIRRAVGAVNSGNPEEGARLCRLGLKHRPDDPALCHLLAAVLFAQGDEAAADASLRTSLAGAPDNVPARILACRIARAKGDFPAALAHLDRIARTSPGPQLFAEMARTHEQSGNVDAACEAWRAVLRADPRSQMAAARLGHHAWKRGAFEEAETLLEQATAGDGAASAWFDLGLVRQDRRDFHGAATAFRRVLELEPNTPEAAVNLGTVLQEAGDLRAAMAAYGNAYRLRPSTFGTIAMALTSGSSGRLWIDEARLRASLAGSPATPGAEPFPVDSRH
jgi:tetratricopeptide (TPR) repeat protein